MTKKQDRIMVIGCGHTGTTLVSGILHSNGYGNPDITSLFENGRLNSLNQRILEGVDVGNDEISRFFEQVEVFSKGRWVLKDPRSSETIEKLLPFMPRVFRVIYNFRNAGSTIRHLYEERVRYEPGLSDDQRMASAEDQYLRQNRAAMRFLERHPDIEFLVLDYDDLVDRKLDSILNRFIGRRLDFGFLNPRKRRSMPLDVSNEVKEQEREIRKLYHRCIVNAVLTMPDPVSVSALGNWRVRCILRLRRWFGCRRARCAASGVVGE